MKKNRYSDEKIVSILRESSVTSVADAARKHGVTEQTIIPLEEVV